MFGQTRAKLESNLQVLSIPYEQTGIRVPHAVSWKFRTSRELIVTRSF